MKKIFICLTLILTIHSFNAQIFFENWDNPQAWSSNDTDGDGNDWFVRDLSFESVNISGLGNAAVSESWNNIQGPLTPDNLLISPAIDLSVVTGNITFSFDIAAYNAGPTFQFENYSVYVVSDLADLATAAPIFSETIAIGDNVVNHAFDLSSFAGQATVFLVFRHHDCTDMEQLILDNITVANANFTVDKVTGTNCETYTFSDLSTLATTFSWDFGSGASPATAVGQGPHAVTYSTGGLKTISLTTDGIATETKVDLIDVTLVPTPTVDPIADQTHCVGVMSDPITFTGTGSGAQVFDWTYTTVPAGENIGVATSGSGDIASFLTTNITTSPIVATFEVTSTDGGCTGSPTQFTITVNPLDDAGFTYLQSSYCFGSADEPVSTVNTLGGTFSSTFGGFVDAVTGTLAISTSPINTYDVTYTTNGCVNSSTISIDIIGLPTVDPIANQFVCENAMTTDILFTGTGATYDWSYTNTGTDNIGIAFAGTGDILSFLTQNNTGDTLTSTFTVIPQLGTCSGNPMNFDIAIEQSLALFPINDITVCEGDVIPNIPFVVPASATADWTNNNINTGLPASGTGNIASFVATNGTLVTITSTIDAVLNLGSCSSPTLTFDINVNPILDPSFTISSSSICSDGVNPTTTITGDAGGVFSAGAGLTINAATGQINLATSTPGTYTVTYTIGSFPCIQTAIFDFEIIETPVIAAISDINECHGTVIPTIDISALSTFPIDWTNDNTTTGIVNVSGSGDIPSFIANNPTLGGGTRTSIITLNSINNGCPSNTETFDVVVNANPIVNAGANTTICEGTPLTLTATGTPTTNFSWDQGVVQGVAFTPTNGTYIYTATGDLTIGTLTCTTLDQVTITVNVTPDVNAGVDAVACEFSQFLLTGSGASTMVWNNGVVDNVPFVPFISGDYIVTGTNSFGCSDKDTMVLTIESLPIPSFTQSVPMGCSPSGVTFTGNSTNLSVFTISDGTVLPAIPPLNSVIHTFTNVGVYDVTLMETSSNGCIGSTTVPGAFVLNPDPVSSFEVSTSIVNMIDPTAFFTNNSVGAILYEWNFGDNSGPAFEEELPHAFPSDVPGEFTISLIAETQFGCKDTSYAQIIVEESLLFYIPNSFTPNGDEFNNKFQPVFYSGLDPQVFNMKVFNRFGQLIFESNDASLGWDGDYGAGNGIAEAGVYTFKMEFSTSTKDEKKLVVGSLILIR
ncbi:MAG: choice-of-anchor J domain-containing protein [Bacteroidota bacterium]